MNNLQFILAMICAFAGTIYSIPRLVLFARKMNFYDEPDNIRKLHTQRTPNMGGVAIFVGTISASTIFFIDSNISTDYIRILGCIIGLFFIGVKDDLLPVTPIRRLIYEILFALVLIFAVDLRVTSFFGLFNIKELPYWFSIIFTTIFIVGIINSINMIDGVDGLLGTFSIISLTLYAYLFYIVGQYEYSIIAFSMIGALIGFLWYNLHPAKIFMGDSGSMFIGGVFTIFTLEFLANVPSSERLLGNLINPANAFALIALPVIDMIFVSIIRIYKKRPPFSADRSHIHHRLLDFGISPAIVSILIGLIHLSTILITFYISSQTGRLTSLAISIGYVTAIDILIYILFLYKKNKKTPINRSPFANPIQ